MVDVFVVFLTLGCLAMAIACLIGIIRPIRSLGMTKRGHAVGLLVGAFALMLFGGMVVDASKPADRQHAPAAQASTTAAKAPKRRKPVDEQHFVAAIIEARDAYRSAANDMAKGQVRITRKEDICTALPSFAVSDWEGSIYSLSSNNDGRGVLEISVGPQIWIKTWNNAVSDYSDGTLIDPRSAVYAAAVKMRRGDKVRFSGTFLHGEKDCVHEASLSQAGSMMEPEFIMRFSDLSSIR